jgi:diaminopimelate decarboxylase
LVDGPNFKVIKEREDYKHISKYEEEVLWKYWL